MENRGLFEIDGNLYTLKFNMDKVKQIETLLDISFTSEVAKTGGILSFRLLEALFSVGLYDANDEKSVKGKKAQDIYNSLLENEGYMKVAEVALAKVEDDLGFLFR